MLNNWKPFLPSVEKHQAIYVQGFLPFLEQALNIYHEITVAIDPDHPALEGHFPDNPVVPAVVILGEVFQALHSYFNNSIHIVTISTAKFITPLKPGENLHITLESQEAEYVQFTCRVGHILISTGSLRYKLREQENSE